MGSYMAKTAKKKPAWAKQKKKVTSKGAVATKGTAPAKKVVKKDKPFPVQAPRGMRDILPQEQKYWEYVTETAKQVIRGWDFQRVDTPIMEETILFDRGLGSNTDVVAKEMFYLKSRGSAQYSLRPEGTAPLVRAYVEHGMRSWPKPVKLFYIGPFFRYERPQAGRWRQHHQFGMEVFGSVSPSTEAELIYVAHVLLQQLGLEEYTFKINSLGDSQDRKEYIKVLKEHYQHNRRKLCQDCKVRLKTNPLRVLDCKEEKCQQVANTAPQLVDHISEESKEHFDKILLMLDELEVPYEVTSSLVRGLDYYTRTVWEVVPKISSDVEGEQKPQASYGGGGRYDGLVKALGGRKDSPGVGMSFGVERIIDGLKSEGVDLIVTDGPEVFIAQLGERAKVAALKVMRLLQEAQIRFAESIDRDGMQPQLKLADRLGAKWVLVLGQKEVLDKSVILRNVESGMQEVVSQSDLVDELQKRLNHSS